MATATKRKGTTRRTKGGASAGKRSGSSKTRRAGSSAGKAAEVPSPVDRGANALAAATHAAKGTKAAGQAVGAVAGRAKRPLIIGGAAAAGAAAGLALTKRR